MKSGGVISLASLISNCHLIFLSTFCPPIVFLCLSGLHSLQNSYCPGQRGDRLLLLEDDCPRREQRWERIPTSDWLLTITFIFKCHPCTPPNPTFCFQVSFFFFLSSPKWENVLLSFQIPSVTIYSRLHHLGSVQAQSQLDASTYSPADSTQICPASRAQAQCNCVSKHLIGATGPFQHQERSGGLGGGGGAWTFEMSQHLLPDRNNIRVFPALHRQAFMHYWPIFLNFALWDISTKIL